MPCISVRITYWLELQFCLLYNINVMFSRFMLGKNKLFLLSAIISLMFLFNDYAVAETVVPVSSGTELKSAIQNAKNPTIIEFVKKDNDIDISGLDKINLNTNAIEIDGKGYNLINERDSRFMFIDNSSLTIKNLNYVGKNSSINISNKNATIVLENVAISGRTTTGVYEGPVLYMVNCNLTLNNVSVASSNVNIQGKNISGGVIYLNSQKSQGTITDLKNNQITSNGVVNGGLFYNRRTLTPIGELFLKGNVEGNIISAGSDVYSGNIYGGIVNNEGSKIDKIEWTNVDNNKISNVKGLLVGGFIQNKLGTIEKLKIDNFTNNTVSSSKNLEGALIYNESGTINNLLEIGKITGNTITAKTDYNGLITNVGGTIDSIKIGSISNNTFEANFLRGGVINLQGASIEGDINIGDVNDNTIKADTATGFVLYLRELPKNQKISSSFKNLNVNQISGNKVEATNITSLLLRTALVPVSNETVISKNGNITVNNISDNNFTAINCNDNARGGIIYNFLHSSVNTINTTVSLGDINLKEVLNNHLEATIIDSTRALNGRHASGTIIANSIQMCQGTAIIKSITGKYIGNSIVSKAMPASGGVIFNSLSGKGKAFAGIGFTLNDKNEIVPINTTAISGTYKDNFVKTDEGDANGGVIANYIEASKDNDDVAQIGSVKADFSGNYVISTKNRAFGGAISNFVKSDNDYKNAIIDSISGNFENNYARTESTDSEMGAFGGAICNNATIKSIDNSVFKNNFAISSNNVENMALGGAIYTKKDLIINANNGLTEFTGNYVSSDGGTTKRYEAIYVNATGKTLTLNATAKGTILLNDYINGVNGYNVLLKGDSNSVIKLHQNADIKNGANVSVDDNIVIDTADGKVQNFSEFNSFTSSASAKYNIDLDFSKTVDNTLNYSVGNIADGFSTKGNSNGYITLDGLKFVDSSLNEILNKNFKIQIIKNNDNLDNLQLALSDKLTSGKISQIVNVEKKDLTATANYKDMFGDITTTKDIYGILGLDKTNTTNDSISIKVTKIDVNVTATITDVLVALTKEEITGSDGSVLDKTFNLFDEDEFGNKTPANYKASDNLGTTYKKLNIVGASNTDTSGKLILSELDLNGKTGFVINEGSTLNISDINLKGNDTVITNNNGVLNFLNNNIINGKITGTTATNTGVLNIDADNLGVELKNNGTLNLGTGTITKVITGTGTTNITGTVTNNFSISQDVNVDTTGDLTVNANIGNLTNNGSVNANTNNLTGTINNSGTLNLSGTLDKAILGNGTTSVNGTLNLSSSAKIDGTLDLNNGSISTTDSSYTNYKITTINGSGKANIDVDWTNSKADSFDSTSGNGVLDLTINETSTENIWESKTIQITNGGVGITLNTTTGTKEKEVLGSDELKANSNWSDKVGAWKRTDTYSETTSAVKSEGSLVNDSIRYEVTKTNEGTKTYTTDGDVLALIVQNTIAGSKDKTFTTTNANDIYIVKENLGILADNLTISGTKDGTNISTIKLGEKQGITIDNSNSLVIKDVKITANGLIINATSNESKVELDNTILEGNVFNQGSLTIKNTNSVSNITGSGKTEIISTGKLTTSELVQNELVNKGVLTVNNLQITTSADNSGTITNNGTTSSIKNLTNTGKIDGTGNLELSGDSTNKGTISQTVIKVSGTLDNTLGKLSATDKIENTGTITTSADKIIATNGIKNDNSLILTGGSLSTQVSGSGTTKINGTVINNLAISQDVNVSATGALTVKANIGNLENNGTVNANANNLTGTITNLNSLVLNGGTLSNEITGSGTTNITGTVTNNVAISQDVNVDTTGDLTVNANIGNLTNNGSVNANTTNLTGTINNSGTLNLSGTLNKEISGLGTTKILGTDLTLVNGAIIKGTLEVNNKTLNLLATNTEGMFNNVKMNSGTLNLINNTVNNLSANSFIINGNVNVLLDADLEKSTMDRLPSTTVVNGLINVKGINLLSDSKGEKVYIPFAYDNFKDKVQTSLTTAGKDVENAYQTTMFAPIFKYDVSYNKNNGYFLFSRGSGKSSADFNPAVLPSVVNSQVGAYSALNESFNYAFRHADYSFMTLPKRIRTMSNHCAITENQSMQYETEYSKMGCVWYQPYANFERIGLANGPKVDVQSYGSLIGGDTKYKQLKNGWGTVITPYIGYNGTSQSYSGVSTTTNGGLLGLTQTFYRGNLFTGLTINVGATNGESNTMYGNENYTSLMAGVGSKTGYNFEFKNGKFILQPSLLVAYTFVNTFDYTNASGVKISSDPLNSIQFHPNIKFMGNVGKGWQPYACIGMVWNILNETKVTANDIRLPEMSIKPYVEYGIGLQKCWNSEATGFIQAIIRNGGRNGVALMFGFKWALGHKRIQNI